jgi:hypothetical protein
MFTLKTPAGEEYSETVETAVSEFDASIDTCDTRIGKCYFRGNLNEYHIYYRSKKIEADIHLSATVPSWRPGTGHILFGKKEQHYFAWLPAVPEGTVNATITIEGITKQYSGSGYHDHNWGDISMLSLFKHWYWGRAKVGDYQIISSYITAEKKYGYSTFPIFMIAKGGEILADNAIDYLTFSEDDPYIDSRTGKTFYNRLTYEYNDKIHHYRVTYQREKDIEYIRAIDTLSAPLRAIAGIAGMDGVYSRFSGKCTVERFEGNAVVEEISEQAIWELTAKI